MAKKGKRGAVRTRTRTIVKYRNRAVRVARRARRAGSSLAKERGATSIAAGIVGYLDGKRAIAAALPEAQRDGVGKMLLQIPTVADTDWIATVGVAAHFYAKSNRAARWADKLATAALAVATYKVGRNMGAGDNAMAKISGISNRIAGDGEIAGGWIAGE